jgi:outer membrane murein-binding lipoprotein Lpp
MTPRDIWELFWDKFTMYKVYFYQGWQYASVIVGLFNIATLLIVSNFTQYLPESMRYSTVIYAVMIMAVLVVGTTIFGSVAFYKGGQRENNMVLKNSTDLNGKLDEMNNEIKQLRKEIKVKQLRNEIKERR